MGKVTLNGLLAHKLRLALTAIAIVLGVTFIAGTYVLTDTLHDTFYGLVGTIYKNIDFQVRGVAQFPTSNAATAVRNPVPGPLLATVRSVPGVAAAEGGVSGYAQFVAPNGTPISNSSEPTLGQNFDPNPAISPLRVVEGHPPTTPDDVLVDAATAGKYHFRLGQHVKVLFSGGEGIFTISGIAQYGTASTLAGVTLAAFTLPTAQQVMNQVSQLNTISVVTQPGANIGAVGKAIARVLPQGVEVVTGQTVLHEQTSSIDQQLSFFSTALVIFALVALFVGAFTIFNTFSILVGQRTRELALLRAVGASRRQVFRSMLTEAAIVGALSSAIGVGLGVLAALGLEELLRGFGVTLPSGPLVFQTRTAVIALAVGIGVTLVAAIGPARHAVRIPPIAALRDDQPDTGVASRQRLTGGSGLALMGIVLLVVGLSKPAVALVGLGAAAIFLGTAALAPVIARPLSSAIGLPVAHLLGVAGRLGRENSMRSPRRTAQTASALMVGLALVSAISVFGVSASSSSTSSFDRAVRADLIVSTTSSSGTGNFSATLPNQLAKVPGVTAATVVYSGQFEIRDSVEHLAAVPAQGLSKTVIVHLTSGAIGSLAAGELLIDSTTATSDHLAAGDPVGVKFALTGSSTMRVGGIYQPNALIGSYLVSDAFYRTHYRNPTAGRRPDRHQRQTDRGTGGEAGDRLLPGRPGSDRRAIQEVADGIGQPAPRPRLRAARPRRVYRTHRDRQHPHAFRARTHPGDRPPARRRDEASPGPLHDPIRVGDSRHLRRHHRHRHRHAPGSRPRLHTEIPGHHHHHHPDPRPGDLPRSLLHPRTRRGHLARPACRATRRPGRHRLGVASVGRSPIISSLQPHPARTNDQTDANKRHGPFLMRGV